MVGVLTLGYTGGTPKAKKDPGTATVPGSFW